MLSSKRRVQKGLFSSVLKDGKSLNFPTFSIKYAYNPELIKKESLFSIVVSKKITKTAVLRNKIRRQAYSVLKDLFPEIKKNYIVTFFLRDSIIGVSFDQLRISITDALKKIRVLE